MMMVLFPLPCATYAAYLTYAYIMFTWTNTITLHRFKKLRSVLHFNSNLTEVKGVPCTRHAHCWTFKKYNMSLSHPWIGIVSWRNFFRLSFKLYCRELFFPNSAKNCGKVHFRFYLLCDTSTFACLMIKVATRNDRYPTDPEETLESIQQEANYSLLNKLVLVMCHK
jgi:hypothetical protein